MPLADGTLLLAADGSRQLDADGVARMASATDDSCCCGGCPEGCVPCASCCFSTTSKLLVTVETLRCQYDWRNAAVADCETDPPQSVTYTKITDAELSFGGTTELDPEDITTPSTYWYNTDAYGYDNSRAYTDSPPASCEPFTPLPNGRTISLYLHFNCETRHWHLQFQSQYSGTFDKDLGEGDCSGITMSEFIYLDGLGCPTEMEGDIYVVFSVRVSIEVIDNDDCMAV